MLHAFMHRISPELAGEWEHKTEHTSPELVGFEDATARRHWSTHAVTIGWFKIQTSIVENRRWMEARRPTTKKGKQLG